MASETRRQTIRAAGHDCALVAEPAGDGAGWVARVERCAPGAEGAADAIAVMVVTTMGATGPTAEEALANLVAAIGSAAP